MTCNFVVGGIDRYTIELRHSWWTGSYQLYVIAYPPDPFRGSVSQNHLFATGQICISSGQEPTTVDRAKAIALAWCEGYSQYIRSGVFPNGAKRVNVRS